jgi:hypothetical protein
VFWVGGMYHKLVADEAAGKLTLEKYPRWEYPRLRDVEQPRPLTTELVRLSGASVLFRSWAEGDSEKCKLCYSCRTYRGPKGLQCDLTILGDRVPEGDLALFREDMLPVPVR